MKYLLFHHRRFLGEGGFDLVAEVTADAVGDIWAVTQHRMGPCWTEKPQVKALVNSPRSTSVGDIIVTEDLEVLQIEMSGYRDITSTAGGQIHLEAARRHWNV